MIYTPAKYKQESSFKYTRCKITLNSNEYIGNGIATKNGRGRQNKCHI